MTSDDERDAEYVRLRSRSWLGALPWIITALVAWAGGLWCSVVIYNGRGYSNVAGDYLPPMRDTLLPALQQILVWLGVVLVLGAVLVLVLRQHHDWIERLRSLDDEPLDDESPEPASPVSGESGPQGPPYAQNNWDD
jgi:hypothetical protein